MSLNKLQGVDNRMYLAASRLSGLQWQTHSWYRQHQAAPVAAAGFLTVAPSNADMPLCPLPSRISAS